MARELTVLVLAAGRGTRMRSSVAKVLHPVLGRPLLAWPLEVARALPAARRGVIVGFQAEAVARALPPASRPSSRSRLSGTGHAVRQARALFAGAGRHRRALGRHAAADARPRCAACSPSTGAGAPR